MSGAATNALRLSELRPSERRPAVLHFAASGTFGGLETMVLTLARAQHAHGLRVGVALSIPRGTRSELARTLEAAGVPVFAIPLAHRAYLKERREAAALIDTWRPDLIHTHGYRPDVLVLPTARRVGVRTVSTVHGTTGGDLKNRFYERLQWRMLRRADGVVAVSAPLRFALAASGIAAASLHVVRNGVTPPDPLPRAAARAVLGLRSDRLHIGWIGRVSHEKGLDVMIRALAVMPDLPVTLSVVGSGPEEQANRRLAAELGVAARISWAGPLPSAGTLLRAFDVVVLSSRTEGTPLVLLEAMAAGVPVVSTAVGGIPDVVDSQQALLVPPEDHAALAAAILDVRANSLSASARAERARARHLSMFTAEACARSYASLYAHVLETPRGS